MQKLIRFTTGVFFLLLFSNGQAQNTVSASVQQYDSRIEVKISYDYATQLNRPNLAGSDEMKYVRQYVYISIRNKTPHQVSVELTYFANKTCGIRSDADVNDANYWGNLKAGETKSTKFDITYANLGDGACLPTKQSDGSYTYINNVGWELSNIKELKPEPKAPAIKEANVPAANNSTSPSPADGNKQVLQNKTTAASTVNPASRTPSTTTNAAGSTYIQRQAALEAAEVKKYNEQRERIAQTQQQNKELSNQLVQGTTELVGMLGKIFAQNRIDRERRAAKKDAARLAAVQEEQAKKQENDDLFSWSAQRNLEAIANGDESAYVELAYDKLLLDKPDEAERWYKEAAEKGDVRGMIGMAKVTEYRISKLTKTGIKKNDQQKIADMKSGMLQWEEKAVMAGSIEACSTLVAYYRADPKMTSFNLLKGDERIISILKQGEQVGYMTPFRHLGIIFAGEAHRLYEAYIVKRKLADTTGSASLLRLAADRYSPEALVELLKIYATGYVQNSDTAIVMQILSKAAMLGNIEAIDNLVFCYSTGYGVKINPEKVVFWSHQKELYTQYGTDLFTASHQLYEKGINEFLYSTPNYEQSMKFLLLAADLGNAKSMEKISWYYTHAGMIKDGPDPQKSEAWKQKAKLVQREKPYEID